MTSSTRPRFHVEAGGGLLASKPCVSRDAKYVFCCCGKLVRVFVAATGDVLRDLKVHTDLVTGVVLNPTNRCQIYSSSVDITLALWDFEDGILLKRFVVETRLESAFRPSGIHGLFFGGSRDSEEGGRKERLFLVLSRDGEKSKLHLLSGNAPELTNDAAVMDEVLMTNTNETEAIIRPDLIDVGCGGSIVAAVNPEKKKFLYVHDTNAKQFFCHRNFKDSMTCVSCHPRLPIVIVGCKNGMILVFREANTKRPTRVIYHWHHLPVLSTAFTKDGNHFLSGGRECVMVRWNLNCKSELQFVPRMGAAITRITVSPNNDFYLTGHSDNSLCLVASTREVVQRFRGLVACPFREAAKVTEKLDSSLPLPAVLRSSRVQTGLHRDPKSRCLVFNGFPGHLQFYDHSRRQHLYSLDVLGLNYVSPETLTGIDASAWIEHVAIDDAGNWLATVEQWKTAEFSRQLRIKIWRHDDKSKSFKLNTILNQPHSGEVTRIEFRGYGEFYDAPMLATAGVDGKAKLWCFVEEEDVDGKQSFWSNEAVAVFQGQDANDLGFSEDGSILAVAFGRFLTLWTSESCELKDSHANPDKTDGSIIRAVKCGRRLASHLFVYATRKSLVVYNALTLGVDWFEDLTVTQLIRDPLSPYMAVVEGNWVRVFRPDSPLLVESIPLDSSSTVISAIFEPRVRPAGEGVAEWRRASRLLLLTEEQELMGLDEEEEGEKMEEMGVRVKRMEQRTTFGALVAEETRTDVTKEAVVAKESVPGHPLRRFVDETLATPAHVLPPLESLCSRLHSALLLSPATTTTTTKESSTTDTSKQTKQEIRDESESHNVKRPDADDWDGILESIPVRDYSWLWKEFP